MKSNQLLSLKRLKKAAYAMVMLFALLLNAHTAFAQNVVDMSLTSSQRTNRCPGNAVTTITFEVPGFVAPYTTYDVVWGFYDGANDPSAFVETDDMGFTMNASYTGAELAGLDDIFKTQGLDRTSMYVVCRVYEWDGFARTSNYTDYVSPEVTFKANPLKTVSASVGTCPTAASGNLAGDNLTTLQTILSSEVARKDDAPINWTADLKFYDVAFPGTPLNISEPYPVGAGTSQDIKISYTEGGCEFARYITVDVADQPNLFGANIADKCEGTLVDLASAMYPAVDFSVYDSYAFEVFDSPANPGNWEDVGTAFAPSELNLTTGLGYNVRLKVTQGGCSQYNTQTYTITSKASSQYVGNLKIGAGDNKICKADVIAGNPFDITMTTTEATETSFKWYMDGEGTPYNHVVAVGGTDKVTTGVTLPTTAGKYYVYVKFSDAGGCDVEYKDSIIVEEATIALETAPDLCEGAVIDLATLVDVASGDFTTGTDAGNYSYDLKWVVNGTPSAFACGTVDGGAGQQSTDANEVFALGKKSADGKVYIAIEKTDLTTAHACVVHDTLVFNALAAVDMGQIVSDIEDSVMFKAAVGGAQFINTTIKFPEDDANYTYTYYYDEWNTAGDAWVAMTEMTGKTLDLSSVAGVITPTTAVAQAGDMRRAGVAGQMNFYVKATNTAGCSLIGDLNPQVLVDTLPAVAKLHTEICGNNDAATLVLNYATLGDMIEQDPTNLDDHHEASAGEMQVVDIHLAEMMDNRVADAGDILGENVNWTFGAQLITVNTQSLTVGTTYTGTIDLRLIATGAIDTTIITLPFEVEVVGEPTLSMELKKDVFCYAKYVTTPNGVLREDASGTPTSEGIFTKGGYDAQYYQLLTTIDDDDAALLAATGDTWNAGANDALGTATLMVDELTTPGNLTWYATKMDGTAAKIFYDNGNRVSNTHTKHPVLALSSPEGPGEYRITLDVVSGGCHYYFYDTLLIVPTVDNAVATYAVPTLAQSTVCLPSADDHITLEITNAAEVNWDAAYQEWYAETGAAVSNGWSTIDITTDGQLVVNTVGPVAASGTYDLKYLLYDTDADHYARYDNDEIKRCATIRKVVFTVSGKSITTVATPGHDLLTGDLAAAEGICVKSEDIYDLDELIANNGPVEFVGGVVTEVGPRQYFIDDFSTPVASGNMFNTEENGLTSGTHKIYVQTEATDGCIYKDSLEITVYENTPLTAANFRLTDSTYNFCESLEAVDLINELADAAWTVEAYEYAGPLTGPGTNYTNVNTVSTNSNKSASPYGVFAFYPAASSNVTTHQINYFIRDEHKCASDSTFDVTIEKQATMSLTSPLTTCNYVDSLVLADELQAVGVTFDNGITVDYSKFTFTIDGKEETKILVNEYKDIDVTIEYQDSICASTKLNTTIAVSEDLTGLTVTPPATVCVGDNVDLADYVSLTDGDADEYFYIDGGMETDNGGSIYTVQSGITDFFWYYVKGDCKAKAVAFTLTPKEIFDGTEALAYTGTNYNKSLKAGETRTVNATLTTVGNIQGITVIKDGAAAPADLTVIPAAGVVSFTDGFGEYAFEFTDFCGNSFKDTLNIYETAELVSATVDATELCATTPVEFTVNFVGAVDSVKLYDAVADTVIDYVKDPVSPLTMNNVPAADTMTYKVQIVGKGYYEGVNELVNSDEMTVRQYITPVVAYDTITGGLPVKPTLCEGETVTLTATIEGDAQKVEWRDGTDVWNEFVGLYEITAQPNVHYGFRVTPFCGAATTDEFFFPQTLVPTEAPVLEYSNGDNDQNTICSTPNGTEKLTVSNSAALNIDVAQGVFYTVDNNNVTVNVVADNGDYTADVLGEGSYIYVVTDSCGKEWRSNVIKITTVEAPTVTVVPDMATVCAGDVATFTLTTTGDIADTTFDNGSTIAGLKEGTTTITVTDICGVTATETVDIGTYVTPSVTYTTPAEGSICAGETFTLAANVTGDAQKVEWKDGSNVWNEIVGVTEITASPEVHYGFRVISYCNDTTSKEFFYPATLVPAEEPVMSFNNGMNANLTVCAGGNGTLTIDNNAALNIDVTEGKFYKVNEATASVDAIADNGDWTATVGAGSYIYRFVDSCGTAHESNVIKVVEIEAPTVEVTPDANIVCAGQTVTFTIVTTGEDVTVSYDNASTDAGLIAGTTIVTATDACGATATTTVDIATYVDPTVTYTTPAEGSICAGETFTLAANVTGDAQKVEWKDGSNVWNEIVDVYEITASPDVHYGFRVISYCNDTTSKEFFYPATLVPTEEPVMSFNNGMNANLTVCAGTPGILTIDNAANLNIDVTEGKFYVVNEATASVDAIADNGDWTASVGAGSYIYKFVDSCGTAHESNVIKVIEIAAPTIEVTPDADVVCAGATVPFTVVTTGEDIAISYDNASTDAGLIAGTTIVTATDACGATATATVTITELVDPTVTFVTPTDKSICAGETKEIVATVNNDYTSYVWEVNGVAQTLNEGTVAIAANDHAKFIVSYQCGADIDTVFSYPATQTIATTPVLTIDNAQICAGGTVTLTVTSDLVGSEANGEFYAAVSGGFDNTTKLTKAAVNDNFVTVTGVNDNTTYRYIVTDSCGNELTSNDVTVTLYEDVLAIVLPLDTMVCAGEETDLLAAISGDVQTITYDGNVVAALPATVGAGNHTIAIDDYCGTTTNIAFTIHEYNATTAVTLVSAAPATLCADNNVQYELSFTVDGDDEIESIKWYQGYPTVSTEIVAAQDELTLSITKPATYYVAVKTSCNAADLMSNVVIPETQTIASIDLTADADTICAGATANLTLGGDVAVADSIAWYDVTTDMNNTTVLASGVATIAVPAGTYKAFVIDSCGTVFEKSITINEYVTPVVNSAVVASTKVCAGEETALTVDITGDIQNYTINGTPVTELPATLGEGTYDINVNDFCGNSIDVLDETVVAYVPTTSITFSEDMHFTLCAGTDNIPHNVYFTRNAGADDEITEIRWYKDGLQQDLNTDKEGNIFLIINEPAAYKVQIVTNCNTLAVDTDFVINPTVMVDANNLFINADALKICADSTTGVHLTGAEAAKTIAWYNITSDINSDAEIVANANLKDIVVSAGMYKAIVTDTCGNAYSRVVNIENFVTPYALTLNVEDTMICAGTTTNLTIAFEGEAKEVTVNNVATTDMTMAVAPGTYKIKVISNCEGDADLEDSITIAETPVVGTIAALGAIGTDTTVCQFSSFDLEVTDDAAAVEYVWANAQPTLQGWELLVTGNKARVTTNQEESVVTVYAVDACGNHSDTVTYTLAVHTNPADVVPVVTVATDVACKDSLVTFTTDVIGDLDVYTWVATPAEALTEVTVSDDSNVAVYRMNEVGGSVTVTLSNVCGATVASAPAYVETALDPVLTFNVSKLAICDNETITLDVDVEGTDNYTITDDFGETYKIGETELMPHQNTTYTLTAINACGNVYTETATVTVTPLVDIDITYDQAQTTLFEGQGVVFTVTPANLPRYTYYFNNAEVSSTALNEVYVKPVPTNVNNTLRVVADNGNGCATDETINVFFGKEEMPNMFTPDGDGVNDVFMAGYKLKVWNRWGAVVYEGEDGWNGTFDNKGESMAATTYYYIVEVPVGAKMETHKGTVTLVRR